MKPTMRARSAPLVERLLLLWPQVTTSTGTTVAVTQRRGDTLRNNHLKCNYLFILTLITYPPEVHPVTNTFLKMKKNKEQMTKSRDPRVRMLLGAFRGLETRSLTTLDIVSVLRSRFHCLLGNTVVVVCKKQIKSSK